MLLSLSLGDSICFALPFLLTGAITVAVFRSAAAEEIAPWRVTKILLGIFFLTLTLGLGACFGLMWLPFNIDQ